MAWKIVAADDELFQCQFSMTQIGPGGTAQRHPAARMVAQEIAARVQQATQQRGASGSKARKYRHFHGIQENFFAGP